MRALRAWFLRLTHLFGKRRRDREFQAELDAHLALHVADNVRAGLPPDQARRRALMALGGIEQTKEQHRDRQGFRCLEELLQDVRVAARSLMKYPIAALVAIVSLAGGVGATTATLAIRDVVFLKPPSLYRNPAELSRVQVGSPEHPIMPVGNPVPGKLFAVWRHAMPGAQLAGVALARVREARTTGRSSSTVRVRSVTPDFFSVLGVDPIIGGPSRERVPSAVLSHQLWQTLFGGRADAIGSIIWIANQPFSVPGVMPDR